jgi:nucleotide-binding universal stress UspA family protein
LLGDRVGRVALATVLTLDTSTQRHLDTSAARERLEHAAGTLAQTWPGGVPRIVLLSGYPTDELERLAIDDGYDLLVVGARGAGLSTALLGSTATKLAARGRVPVMVAGGDAVPRHPSVRQQAQLRAPNAGSSREP